MKKTVEIVVKGKVQGVWFRKTTQQKANELLIEGYVKNLPDGSVHILAKAEENVLDPFIEWCKSGPEKARVESFEMNEIENEDFNGFEIR